MLNQNEYTVLSYQHIDDKRCFSPLKAAMEPWPPIGKGPSDEELEQLHDELSSMSKEAGWEGDGTIGCAFIPPCFVEGDNTWCKTIYHVKQSNDGTSWLAIPKVLRLEDPIATKVEAG
jgi:hypothetical protein